MINQTHIVIDLETMGIGTNAAIGAIGAVRIKNGHLGGEFYRRVDLASSLANGGTTDASTTSWWQGQDGAARGEVDGSKDSAHIIDALNDLGDFIRASEILANDRAHPWGNGTTFDLRILGEAYDALGEGRPWDFRLERDLRTILALYPEAKNVGEFEGIKHHALHDARHEAKQLCKALRLHAGQREGRAVLIDLLHQAAFALINDAASLPERLQLARNIQGELENNPLQLVEREEVRHG